MSKLNKRYLRNIKKNSTFYISAILMTTLSIFIFLSILITRDGLQNYVKELNTRNNVEEAQFATLYEISENDIDDIESQFNLSMEKMRYIDIDQDEYTLRLYHAAEKINLYEVYEGNDITDEDDILLSKGFAEEHAIKIGDTFRLEKETFVVKGFFIRPDYINMLETVNGSYRDNEAFGLGMVHEDRYELLGAEKYYYSVIYNEESTIQFREYIRDEYETITYTEASINGRIQAIQDKTDSYGRMAYFAFILMLVLTTGLISIVLSRKISSEHKQMGTLKAMGFRSSELTRHYLCLPVIAGIAGGLFGLILMYFTAQPIAEYYAGDYEPVPVTYVLPVLGSILSFIVPIIFYVFGCYFTLQKLVKKNAVKLLTGDIGKKPKGQKKNILTNSNMKFETKFIIRTIFRNRGRSAVVLFGLLVGCYVMSLGYICNDSCRSFIENSVDNIGNYEYQYTLNTYLNDDREDSCTTILSSIFVPVDGVSSFSIMGVSNSDILDLTSVDGKKISIAEESEPAYYMSRMSAMIYGVQKGETFTFISPATLEEHTITITDIVDNDAQEVIFTPQSTLCELMDADEGSYNLILSNQKIDIDDTFVKEMTTKESLKSQIQAVIDDVAGIVSVMIYVGMALCAISVYLSVNLLVEENINNVSMLKIFGYRNPEISKLLLRVYHFMVPIAIVIALPLGVLSGDLLFSSMIDTYKCYIHSTISMRSIMLCTVFTILSYIVSVTILKRKCMKVDMVESLKNQNE